MSETFRSPRRSTNGSLIRTALGAIKTHAAAPAPGADGSLFCCGDFTGRVALFDDLTQDWISIGNGAPNYPEFLLVHDGELYAAGQIDTWIAKMDAINSWSGFHGPEDSTVFDMISYGGYLTAIEAGLTGAVYQRIAGAWVQLGSNAPAFISYLMVDGADLWCGNSRLEGSTWVQRTAWEWSGAAGAAGFTFHRGPELIAWLSPSGSTFGVGYYKYNSGADEWQMTELLPTRHTLGGSESITGGFTYTGAGSSGWEFTADGTIGTRIAAMASNSQRILTQATARQIIANGRHYSGTPPILENLIPMTQPQYAITHGGALIVCGEADADGSVLQLAGESFSFKGTTDTYPNGITYHLLSAEIVIPVNLTVADATHGHLADDVPVEPGELTITSVTPDNGPEAGGTAVTVSGYHFTASTSVEFSGAVASNIIFVNSNTITCDTPAGVGAVDVEVIDGLDSDTLTGGFIYTRR